MQIIKRKRLYNSGRAKRKRVNGKRLSLRQKLFFGSKAQRSAAKKSLSNGRRSKRLSNGRITRRRPNSKRVVRRRKNIGEIITLDLVRKNTGRRKNTMARRRINTRRRRRNVVYRGKAGKAKGKYIYTSNPSRRRRRRNRGVTVRRRRRANSGVVTRRRRRNTSRRLVTRSYSRRRNTGRRYRRNSGYRRNGIGDSVSKGLGIVAGMFITGKLTDLLTSVSPSITSGPMSIAASAVIAFAQGWAVKKFTGKTDLAENLTIGGLALAAIKALNMFVPQFSPSLSGLGLIGGSSFTYPQVNIPGNFGKFSIAPDYASAIAAASAQTMTNGSGMRGIFPTPSGGGRVGLKRVGRYS